VRQPRLSINAVATVTMTVVFMVFPFCYTSNSVRH
jgi:hypothetical protein